MNEDGTVRPDGAAARPSEAEPDDLELVKACQAGDVSAFETLFHRYRKRVYGIAFRYLGRADAALDAVQEAFIKVHHGLAKFRGEARFSTWLSRVAVNTCIDLLRARPKETAVEFGEESEDTDRRILADARPNGAPHWRSEQTELAEQIHRAVGRLPPKLRDTFVLFGIEVMSYQDVADVLGCSIGTVMSRLHYARRKLQEWLRPYLQGDRRVEG